MCRYNRDVNSRPTQAYETGQKYKRVTTTNAVVRRRSSQIPIRYFWT